MQFMLPFVSQAWPLCSSASLLRASVPTAVYRLTVCFICPKLALQRSALSLGMNVDTHKVT